jgi:hypothetical protein
MSSRLSAAPVGGWAIEAATEPLMAWRAWALTGRSDGTDLLLRPVASRSRPWRPREIAEAVCKSARFHHAPEPGCTCGLHATNGYELLRKTRCPAVLGRVALWGRVIEHELGYRSQFAYPQRLTLICQFCFWRRGPAGSSPDHVAWFPRDELIPMCGEHLEVAWTHGVHPRRLVPASVVEQRLRDRYAVDALAL